MMLDEREIQYQIQIRRQMMMRERDKERLRKIALNGRRSGFRLLRFRLPRLWPARTHERPEQEKIPVKRYPAESGVS